MKKPIVVIAAIALISGCTTSSQSFYKNPSKIDKASLCRAYLKSPEEPFRSDLKAELGKRGLAVSQCPTIVQNQDAAIAAGVIVAVAAVGVVAVCANNGGCAGGGSYYNEADWDQFYDRNFQLVWACREVNTGRFTYQHHCAGKAQTDWRWPSKYA